MSRLRERAIRGEASSFAYFEWSAAVLDADGNELECGAVTPDQIDDEALWYQANPALGARVPIERVRAERESLPHRGFLTERLGIGAWWPTVEAVDAPITAAEWADLEDSGSKRVGGLVLAFDIDPDRRCALVACGRRGVDDLLHVELLRSASGTSWLRDELERLSDRYDVEAIVTDGYGGNLAMVRTLEDAGLRVRTLTGGEQASACAKLLDLVQGREFRHIGQPELLNALRGAKVKPLGDAWAWSRKASTGDIAAVIAMTLALAVGSELTVGADRAANLLAGVHRSATRRAAFVARSSDGGGDSRSRGPMLRGGRGARRQRPVHSEWQAEAFSGCPILDGARSRELLRGRLERTHWYSLREREPLSRVSK